MAEAGALVLEVGAQADTAGVLRRFWPDHMTTQELIYGPGGLNEALTMPGVANAWTMPIKARIDMLTTGMRTPLGIKVLGSDLNEIQESAEQIESALKHIPGTPASLPSARRADTFWTSISSATSSRVTV